jgi:hypothetical protein
VTFGFAGSTRLAVAVLLLCACTIEAVSFNVNNERASLAREKVASASDGSFDTFLDRLMRAESDGRDFLASSRSTALGPFQFIKGTFLEVTRKHFDAETANMTEEQVLALRTDRGFSRRAVAAYLREMAEFLGGQGLEPTFAHLRLAYLVGPNAAVRVIQASSEKPVSEVLAPGAVKANPFMAGMTAAGLIDKAARDISEDRDGPDAAPSPRVRVAAAAPEPRVAPRPQESGAGKPKCNPNLASCRHFLAVRAQKPRVAESRGPDKAQPRKKRQTTS